MDQKQHWAAILSLEKFIPLDDPHPASAAVTIDGITFCSSILPWSTCGNKAPWNGKNLAEKTANALSILMPALPQQGLVWGGDWNQNLKGGWENVGTKEGQNLLNSAIKSLNLQVPTADLLHRLGTGHHTIDHIAVPSGWKVKSAKRIVAARNGKRLSDHDAYVIEGFEPNQWITENAYYRWVNAGRPEGLAWQHRLDAEKEFRDLK